MRSHSHINTAKLILQSYDGQLPLAPWLKAFFKAEKKYGSTDRKQIAHLCYCYYRLGNSFKHLSTDDRLPVAVFLCSATPNKLLEELKPEWNEAVTQSLQDKLEMLSAKEEIGKIFPFDAAVSKEIDQVAFHLSFLVQPYVFLRIRPGSEEKVIQQLDDAGFAYQQIGKACIALHNQTKMDEILHIDRDVVVQDASSQQVLQPLEGLLQKKQQLIAWDCCAASGGKSILFLDQFPHSRLIVSDVRERILINLQNRFKRAGITNYQRFVGDLSKDDIPIKQKIDVLICDAPCSGSGTWARTPEQLFFFSKEKIEYYAALQKTIAVQASKKLNAGSFFIYITCSVFEQENEQVVDHIVANTSLQLLSMQYIRGYEKKADTLFTALFSSL